MGCVQLKLTNHTSMHSITFFSIIAPRYVKLEREGLEVSHGKK